MHEQSVSLPCLNSNANYGYIVRFCTKFLTNFIKRNHGSNTEFYH